EDRREEGLVVGEAGQHHAGDLGVGRPDLPAHLDPAAVAALVPQAHIEDGDVGMGLGDPIERFLAVGRLADDVDVVFGPEQVAHATADELVVVQEEDADRHAPIVRGRWPSGEGPSALCHRGVRLTGRASAWAYPQPTAAAALRGPVPPAAATAARHAASGLPAVSMAVASGHSGNLDASSAATSGPASEPAWVRSAARLAARSTGAAQRSSTTSACPATPTRRASSRQVSSPQVASSTTLSPRSRSPRARCTSSP